MWICCGSYHNRCIFTTLLFVRYFFFHWTFLHFSFIDKAVCVFCNMLLMAICVIIRNDTSVAQFLMCLIRNKRNWLSSLHRPYIQSRHMVQTYIQSMLSTSDQGSADKFRNIDVIYYKLLVIKNKCNMQLACMEKTYNIACNKILYSAVRSRRIKK